MPTTSLPLEFHISSEAMEELKKWELYLSPQQKAKLLQSKISKDKDEWCIFSGPDLTFDRAGFGQTIAEAVRDYVNVYLKKVS